MSETPKSDAIRLKYAAPMPTLLPVPAANVNVLTPVPAAAVASLLAGIQPAPLALLGAMVSDVAARPVTSVRSYATGMPDLDRLLGGGMSTRQLTTVLGPPGAGKTAWCVALAERIQSTIPVLYISTELEADELASRIAAPRLHCSWSAVVRGKIDRGLVRQALAELRIRLVGCDELPRDGSALDAIAATASAMTAEYGAPPLVIVDYMQDLARGTDEKNLRAKIGDIATALRALAQALDCPLVAVSSVSRAYYGTRRAEEMRAAKDATIYLAAAKESGDVDYASAAVLFLDVEAAGTTEHRLAQVAVAKSRHGETGFAGARFYGATGRWQSDVGAVDALTDGSRAEERRGKADDEDESKVLATVSRLKSLGTNVEGLSHLLAKSDLKASCGIQAARANKAIGRLIVAGKLINSTEVYTAQDRHGLGRNKERQVIDVAKKTVPALVAIPSP